MVLPSGTYLFGVAINTIGLPVYWFGLVPGRGGARQALSVPPRAICTDFAMSHNFTVAIKVISLLGPSVIVTCGTCCWGRFKLNRPDSTESGLGFKIED